MRTLHIFDFDDTLISSNSNVLIKHADGTESSLSSDMYATYDEQPGDQLDFTDFDKYPEDANIIKPVFIQLKKAIISDGADAVVILTARGNPLPVEEFLSDHGIKDIKIVATASSDPRKKAEYVLSRIKEENIDLVKVFEDNAKNIRAIRKVIKDDGKTQLQTHRIVHGKIASIKIFNP